MSILLEENVEYCNAAIERDSRPTRKDEQWRNKYDTYETPFRYYMYEFASRSVTLIIYTVWNFIKILNIPDEKSYS